MRIAIDANVLGGSWGGIPKYLDRIATELIAGGDNVDLLANTRHLSHTIAGAEEVGVRIKGTPLWRQVFLPGWLARRKPDVFWAPESLLPRLSPVPTVVTIHDLASLHLDSVKPEGHRRQFRGAVARSARRASRVIAVSRTTAADIEAHYGIDAGVSGSFQTESTTPSPRATATAPRLSCASAGDWRAPSSSTSGRWSRARASRS